MIKDHWGWGPEEMAGRAVIKLVERNAQGRKALRRLPLTIAEISGAARVQRVQGSRLSGEGCRSGSEV